MWNLIIGISVILGIIASLLCIYEKFPVYRLLQERAPKFNDILKKASIIFQIIRGWLASLIKKCISKIKSDKSTNKERRHFLVEESHRQWGYICRYCHLENNLNYKGAKYIEGFYGDIFECNNCGSWHHVLLD